MKSQIKFPILIYTIWYLVILLFQIFLEPIYKLTPKSLTLYQRLYLSWATYWDSAHYISIAKQGYQFPQQAFFPLWPLLIKIFSYLVGFFNAAFILPFVFGLTAFILFYLLATKLIGRPFAKLALVLFASFPSTMFLHAGYTEGLFLTLTLLSFLMLERKSYLLAAVFGGFSTMTRLTGVGIAGTYLILKQPILKKTLFIFVSISGLLIYMLFLQLMFNNGLLFVDAQKAWCQAQGRCQFVFPLIPLLKLPQPSLSFVFFDWFFSCLFLVMLIPVFKKLGRYYFIFSLISLLLPLFSSTVGMVRYVLVVFPVFFVAPLVTKSKMLFFLICLLLFLLELRFVALFTNGIWVA